MASRGVMMPQVRVAAPSARGTSWQGERCCSRLRSGRLAVISRPTDAGRGAALDITATRDSLPPWGGGRSRRRAATAVDPPHELASHAEPAGVHSMTPTSPSSPRQIPPTVGSQPGRQSVTAAAHLFYHQVSGRGNAHRARDTGGRDSTAGHLLRWRLWKVNGPQATAGSTSSPSPPSWWAWGCRPCACTTPVVSSLRADPRRDPPLQCQRPRASAAGQAAAGGGAQPRRRHQCLGPRGAEHDRARGRRAPVSGAPDVEVGSPRGTPGPPASPRRDLNSPRPRCRCRQRADRMAATTSPTGPRWAILSGLTIERICVISPSTVSSAHICRPRRR